MLQVIKQDWQVKVAGLLFLILSLYWLSGYLNPNAYETRMFGDYPSIYGIMALWGAIWGIIIAKGYGFLKSVMGKAILMFSLGLLAQEAGQIIYAYYSFYEHVAVPYPSLGDIGYFGSILFYIYGIWLLGRAAGVHISLRSFLNQTIAIVIPLLMLGIGYFLFLQGYTFDWSNPIKILLDFGYPLGQAIYISLAILTYFLTRGILGGIMRGKILFILFALLLQFLADYTFLYQSSRGTWSVGGPNDYMYLIAYFTMALGLFQFDSVLKKLKSEQ